MSAVKVDRMKVHFKHIGKPGKVALRWSALNGRYEEVDPEYVTQWQDNDHEADAW